MTVAIQFPCCSLPNALSRHVRSVLAIALTGVSTCAIVNASESDLARQSVPFELQFAGEFGGQPFDCSTRYHNVGSSHATVAVSDFRLYVSRVRLLDASGKQTPVVLQQHGPWQYGGVALLDFENASGACSNGTPDTNSVVKLMAPAGHYTGVAFDIGVPFENNHQDPTLAASPLNLTSLFWSWRGGYRFMRIDLQPEGKSWAIHMGSTGCRATSPAQAPDRCTSPNRVTLEYPTAAPGTSTFVIDPARLLSESDVTSNTEGTSPGCMAAADDPECEAIFKALGLAAEGDPQLLVTAR